VKAAIALEQKQKLDRRRLILAIIAGALFHLWLFYFTFPEMRGMEYQDEVKRKVTIRRWRPPPKEKPEVKPPPKKKTVKPTVIIPVPDPTPDQPEEIQELEPEPEIEDIPLDEDFIWGIPDEPDIPVGEETKIYNSWEVSKEPEIISAPKPSYPEIAHIAGVEAIVVLLLVVDENGEVVSHEVLHSTGGTFKQTFEKEAIQTAYQRYKFKPAIQAGHPVCCTAKITIRFKLK